MYNRIATAALALLLIMALPAMAQRKDSAHRRIYVTTGVGINKIQGSLHHTFRRTIAFNSSFEKRLGRHWFAQAEANFNSLKYNQQQTDQHSDYLFQNTSSSWFLLAANIGRNFPLGQSPWFVSAYAGTGYINVGEPRLIVNGYTGIITQRVVRRPGILGKAGGRIGYNSKWKLLQTIYADGSYWASTIKINQLSVRSVSVFIGIRMAM